MKWALAFVTARVLAEKMEFLGVPINVLNAVFLEYNIERV